MRGPRRPTILAQYAQAFQGTVTAIEGDTVTLETTEVLQGEVGETVQVTAPQGLFDAMIGTVNFQVGGDLPRRGLRRASLAVLLRIGERRRSVRPSTKAFVR